MSEQIKCACRAWDALECARRRHVKSCDDFQRSIESEEADELDRSDECECFCHDSDEDDDPWD